MINLWSNKWRKKWRHYINKEERCKRCYSLQKKYTKNVTSKCTCKKEYKDKKYLLDFEEQLEEEIKEGD